VLDGANFGSAGLTDALLKRVSAKGTQFIDANLSGAVITEAMLDDADFTGALLFRTDFTASQMAWAMTDGAQSDDTTRWGDRHDEDEEEDSQEDDESQLSIVTLDQLRQNEEDL
jgi:uncharacterized protein YjbI with pentapeptide repeats